jgi:putative transposase
VAAVRVNGEGCTYVLAMREGAPRMPRRPRICSNTWSRAASIRLAKRWFVIDGSKAVRAAINAVFGAEAPVQRCRNHKLCNVLGRLSRERQVRGRIAAAQGLEDEKEGRRG